MTALLEESEQQTLARESARDFAEKRLRPLAQKLDEEEAIPAELYAEAAELGFFGMMVPEQYGGLGLGYSAYVAAMEELARGYAGFQVGLTVHNSLACGAVSLFGTDEQKKKYLPRLAKGELIGAYCLSEPSAGSDAGSLRAAAKLDGNQYVLSGAKAWVTNGGIAGLFIVFASTAPEKKNKGVSCFLVEKGTEGLVLGKKEKKLGIRASDTRELALANCRIPKDALLGTENEGFKIALALLDSGRIAIAAQSLGIARAACEEAVYYAKARVQFGKSLSEFQATQFKIADMTVAIEAARLLTYRAAALREAGLSCTKEASIAKLFASQAANRIAFDALQIHGGNGYIREFAVERLFRDARITEIYEGTSEIQRLIIARDVLR